MGDSWLWVYIWAQPRTVVEMWVFPVIGNEHRLFLWLSPKNEKSKVVGCSRGRCDQSETSVTRRSDTGNHTTWRQPLSHVLIKADSCSRRTSQVLSILSWQSARFGFNPALNVLKKKKKKTRVHTRTRTDTHTQKTVKWFPFPSTCSKNYFPSADFSLVGDMNHPQRGWATWFIRTFVILPGNSAASKTYNRLRDILNGKKKSKQQGYPPPQRVLPGPKGQKKKSQVKVHGDARRFFQPLILQWHATWNWVRAAASPQFLFLAAECRLTL